MDPSIAPAVRALLKAQRIASRIARFVGGFAQARTLTADGPATVLAG
jgi:hypothetical protein